jgi:hypothetical protein
MRNSSMVSSGSQPDLQSLNSRSSADYEVGIPLHQLVAVCRLDDGKPYFSIEVSWLDEETYYASTMTLQLNDPREADQWLSSLRTAIRNVGLLYSWPFTAKTIDYVARRLEQERDYDPQNFRVFRIVQRAAVKTTARASTDDLAKLVSTVCYLAIGVHKVHIIPLPKLTYRSSSTALADLATRVSYGIVTLVHASVDNMNDNFELHFRLGKTCR